MSLKCLRDDNSVFVWYFRFEQPVAWRHLRLGGFIKQVPVHTVKPLHVSLHCRCWFDDSVCFLRIVHTTVTRQRHRGIIGNWVPWRLTKEISVRRRCVRQMLRGHLLMVMLPCINIGIWLISRKGWRHLYVSVDVWWTSFMADIVGANGFQVSSSATSGLSPAEVSSFKVIEAVLVDSPVVSFTCNKMIRFICILDLVSFEYSELTTFYVLHLNPFEAMSIMYASYIKMALWLYYLISFDLFSCCNVLTLITSILSVLELACFIKNLCILTLSLKTRAK